MNKPDFNPVPGAKPLLEPLLLRAAEAARLMAISVRTLRKLTSMHEVPFIRIGRSVRYPVEELRKWITARGRSQ